MRDSERAKALLAEGSYSCVLCRGEQVYTSMLRGVLPLVRFLSEGTDLRDFSAADKIVGKAAAMLFVLARVKEVYAPVMSETATEVFRLYGIAFDCGLRVQTIVNRSGTGPCPMETAVDGISDPQVAFQAIKVTLEKLSRSH